MVNDIPNIPSLAAFAIGKADEAEWGAAFEAFGDAASALGIAGEFMAGAEALSSANNMSPVDAVQSGPRVDVAQSGPRAATRTGRDWGPPAWPVKNLRHGDPRVVIQTWKNSCAAASCEMVARIAGVDEVVNEASLLTEIAEMNNNAEVALRDTEVGIHRGLFSVDVEAAANSLEVESAIADGKRWVYDVAEPANAADVGRTVDQVAADGPFIANTSYKDASGAVTQHAVVVLGRDAAGDIMVLDPAGYAYEMAPAEFFDAWNFYYINRK
jgi:hypothetical protein